MKMEINKNGTTYPVFDTGKLPPELLGTAYAVMQDVINNIETDRKCKYALMTNFGLTMGEASRIIDAKPEDFELVLFDIFGE